jgi:DNA-binding NarL/FixJ family response regulator
MSASKIPVIISHRMPLVSAGLEAALRTQAGFEIVSSGERCTPASDESCRDSVLVADSETGVRVASRVRPIGGRVLIVTPDESEASVRCALEAGVRGYLLLTCTPDAIVQAIRRVHDGGTIVDPIVATKVVASLSGRALTDRELDVLGLLMLGLGDKAIARRLDIRLGTVKTHMKAVRVKLAAGSRTEAVVIAQRRGLVPEEVTTRLLEKALHRTAVGRR